MTATVQLRRQRVVVPGGAVVVFVMSVLAMLRVDRTAKTLGGGFGLSFPIWARRVGEEGEAVDDKAAKPRETEEAGRMIGFVSGAEQMARAFARAGSGEGAVGPTTTIGDRAVIPLVETYAAGGFGGGMGGGIEGDGGGGGGGGGVGRSRTVAVAIVGPDGVQIRPVVDVTGLAFTALGALATVLLRRRGRRRRR